MRWTTTMPLLLIPNRNDRTIKRSAQQKGVRLRKRAFEQLPQNPGRTRRKAKIVGVLCAGRRGNKCHTGLLYPIELQHPIK